MKRNLLNIGTSLFCTAVLFVFAASVSAQNMSGTVVTKEVKFARGKHAATITGRARYGMSYVYNLGGRAGQTMTVSLDSKNKDLTFSVIDPEGETLDGGFGVTKYTVKLFTSGKHQIVVVLNDENAGAVPFTLVAGIQ